MPINYTYEQRYVRCGKASCRRCGQQGPGHGPYWYGYWREGQRVRSKYFGRNDPRTVSTAPTRPPHFQQPDRWAWSGRMSYGPALRIMGFSKQPSRFELAQRYRELMQEHHPDHGGSNDIAVAINLANAYLSL